MTTRTPDQQSVIDAHATLALQALLAGQEPADAHLAPVTGDVRACLDALGEALHTGGAQAVRKAFLALSKDNRAYLTQMASREPPTFNEDGSLAPPAGDEQPTRRIRFLPTADFLRRPSQQWIIPGLLPRDGVALVYGLSGAYKSFLVMAWSMCIATGTPWLGRSVVRGPVAYIAAEGSYGIGKRVQAWMAFHQRSNPDEIGVKWFDETLALQDPGNLSELQTALQEDFSEPPVLVVIDTLSRCSAGADENSNTEMAKVLAGADLIRQQLHCTVLIVHHVGKDQQKGPRGASALFGNAETLICVSPTTIGSKVESTKAKDTRPFDSIYLEAKEVIYGPAPDDVSLVLVKSEARDEDQRPALSKAEATMYALLQGKTLTYSEWIQTATDPQMGDACLPAKTAEFAIARLKKAGRVQQSEKRGPYTVVSEAEEPQP